MSTYRHLGEASTIGKLAFTGWGTKFEIADDVAEYGIQNNVPIIPEALYQKRGVTEDEEKKYREMKMHYRATPEFLAKRLGLAQDLHAFRESLKTAGPRPATTEEVTSNG